MNLILAALLAAQVANLNDIPPDLVVPRIERLAPAAGVRAQVQSHQVYLPSDWQQDRSWPVLVEFPGNGGFKNKLGDVSDGTPDGCVLGYGLSAGKGFIWLTLPFVNQDGSTSTKWWGDVEATKNYCISAVNEVCQKWGGDSKRVVLLGFSRGAIACNYIGLHDDKISSLWCGMFCHSHYDGVRESWGYPGADRVSAMTRLKRLAGRPQWISHEGSATETRKWLESTGLTGDWTFHDLPFPNHSAGWVLRETDSRRLAREWLRALVIR
ncbi:MAG: hypothetical protein JNJ83_07910 [Verrucomicrobiaceae bacterium]|nr:hypothetical protein [Verrucomicrobiaceae bacterium]